MKKLMIAAAAAAMVGGAYAVGGLVPIDCTGDEPVQGCQAIVYKLTASGKAADDINNADYKAISALKISKGALAFYAEECEQTGACCYPEAAIFATLKVGRTTAKIAIDELTIEKWSIFGKTFANKIYDYTHTMKKGTSATVDSDLFITGEDVEIYANGDTSEAIDEISIWAAAFGSMKATLSKGKKGNNAYCDPKDTPECVLDFTPKTYNGWFVGKRTIQADGWCFNCDCGEYDVFGGTWKACYQAKYVDFDGAQKLAFGKVLFDSDEDEE